MTSRTLSQEEADRYREWIMQLCPRDVCDVPLWPGFTKLQEFMTDKTVCGPPGISIVNIPGESDPASGLSITSPDDIWGLPETLPSLTDVNPSSQLIIVENICPDTLAILGGTYDVDPQFFAEHVSVLSWYKMDEKVPERLPSLPSTKKREDFLALRYVETREIVDAISCAGSVLWPDLSLTRINQSAGKLEPILKDGKTFPWMAFTRQTISVWCQKKASGNSWIAIMLVNSPFQLARTKGRVGKSEYRNPGLRSKVREGYRVDGNRQGFRQAFCNLLEQRCSADSIYRMTCATDPFLVFYEGYRIISSEWLVVNEYVKRELANIEYRLEKSEPTFQELERYLKELYRIRRRCNKDRELVMEAATQCEKRGQSLWPSSKATSDAFKFAEQHAQELEEDFQYVLDNMSISISRIEKNITLLMALVTISEGRQGLQENRGIAFLTLTATIFLPFETVAAILGIQTQYGPGASSFWMLWAVALPLTIVVVMIPFLYPTASAKLSQLRVTYSQANLKTVHKPLGGLQDGCIEPSDDPMLQLRQMSTYGVV